MAEATAADYPWFNDHWLRGVFCITLVRGLDEVEVLRRLGGERSQPRTLTVGEVGEYAVDGGLLVSFELLVPRRRLGGQPDLLLPQMRAVGLDPDRHGPSYDAAVIAALALAERVTGVHLDPGMLEGPLPHGPSRAPAVGGLDVSVRAMLNIPGDGGLRCAGGVEGSAPPRSSGWWPWACWCWWLPAG